MLVLSRKKDQKIMIGDDIVIMIVEVRSNGSVRLGIDAPKDISVHREEVYNEIKKEQEEIYVTGTGIDPDTIPKGIIKKEQEENTDVST